MIVLPAYLAVVFDILTSSHDYPVFIPPRDINFNTLSILEERSTSDYKYTFCISFRENKQSFALKVKQ